MPAQERWRTLAEVNRHIKNFATHHADKLSLRLLYLIVQAAQDALGTFGVIILNEGNIESSGLIEITLIETLKEEATFIPKYFGFQDEQIGNIC